MNSYGKTLYYGNSYTFDKGEINYYSNLASNRENNNSIWNQDTNFYQKTNSKSSLPTPTQYHKTSQTQEPKRIKFVSNENSQVKMNEPSQYRNKSILKNSPKSKYQSPTKVEYKHHYEKLAEEGDISAMNSFGLLLYHGKNGYPIDYEKASYYFKIAADQGNPDAMYNYGRMLLRGKGVVSNKEEACYYFQMAAERGNVKAMNNYGMMLFNGEGVQSNKVKASHYFKKAADRGNVKAMHNYGMMLCKGKGIQENKREASRYIKMAADQGDANAMASYAMMLSNGEGVRMNKKEAGQYYKMAADKGNVNAMNHYGMMLYNGDGIDINKEEASHYYKMAADNGSSNAMNNYGVMLTNGEGVNENKEEAYQYIKKAAEFGNTSAIHNYNVFLKSYNDLYNDDDDNFSHYYNNEDNIGTINAIYNYLSMSYLEDEPSRATSNSMADISTNCFNNESSHYKKNASESEKNRNFTLEEKGSYSFNISPVKKNSQNSANFKSLSSFSNSYNLEEPSDFLHSAVEKNISNNDSFAYLNYRKYPNKYNTVFVRNIPISADPQALCDYFSNFGKINSVRIMYERLRGKTMSRGIAFVDCESPKTFINIINHPVHVFKGQTLHIDSPKETPKSDSSFIRSFPQ